MPLFARRLGGSVVELCVNAVRRSWQRKWQNGVFAGKRRNGGTKDPGFEPGEQPGDFHLINGFTTAIYGHWQPI